MAKIMQPQIRHSGGGPRRVPKTRPIGQRYAQFNLLEHGNNLLDRKSPPLYDKLLLPMREFAEKRNLHMARNC